MYTVYGKNLEIRTDTGGLLAPQTPAAGASAPAPAIAGSVLAGRWVVGCLCHVAGKYRGLASFFFFFFRKKKKKSKAPLFTFPKK